MIRQVAESAESQADRPPLRERVGTVEAFGFLLGFAYLGFWVFGLVMGVFSIGELLPFTVIAVLILAGSLLRALYTRRALREDGGHPPEDVQQASRHQRELRGY